MFYFSVWNGKYQGGIEVTASHNPPQYNGLKLVEEGAKIIGENSGLKRVKEIALALQRKQEPQGAEFIEKKDALAEYLDFNLKNIDLDKLKNLKIVIDTGNAVSGLLIKALKPRVPFKIFHLFPELDGNFPNHLPNPIEEENIKALEKKVRQERANLGIAFDGDGDRIVFVDEKGKSIPSDFITCLMAEKLLPKNPGGKIVYTIISSNIVKDIVEENGGVAIASRVGHTFIHEKMREEKAVFAGEYSGHFFSIQHHFCEAPLLVMFAVLEEIAASGTTLSELTGKYRRYFYSGVINFKVANKQGKLKELEERFKNGKLTKIDGIRIDFKNFWLLARPSNTENFLRVAVEARDKLLMNEKLTEIKKILQG